MFFVAPNQDDFGKVNRFPLEPVAVSVIWNDSSHAWYSTPGRC
jgi:hypothetical protein